MDKAYIIRAANLIYRICDQHDIKMLTQRLLEGLHSEAWKEGQHQDVIGRCPLRARLWNSAMNHEAFGKGSVA